MREIEHRIQPPLTIGDAVSLATLIGATSGAHQVARLVDGNVVVGTARCIGDEGGNFAGNDEDIRDCFLRVTTVQGFEVFWPVADLLPEVRSGFFVYPYDAR